MTYLYGKDHALTLPACLTLGGRGVDPGIRFQWAGRNKIGFPTARKHSCWSCVQLLRLTARTRSTVTDGRMSRRQIIEEKTLRV